MKLCAETAVIENAVRTRVRYCFEFSGVVMTHELRTLQKSEPGAGTGHPGAAPTAHLHMRILG